MTPSAPAWRVTYTPGEWLVLAGPRMLVVMLPAPPRMSGLVDTLWDDVRAARSVEALLKVFGDYGLSAMTDFAALFWDDSGLHGMARGQVNIVDADTGDTMVSGSDAVTWREESLGKVRHVRVGMQQVNEDEHLRLPLAVGAVLASTIHLSTNPEAGVRFPEEGEVPGEGDRPAEMVGLGSEAEMEPYSGSLEDDDIPMWKPPVEEECRDDEAGSVGQGQVLAVPCARGHENAPGSSSCRICSAPVDSARPRLIDRPALAGVHSNRGDFLDVREAVVVGRSPDALRGPAGSSIMRVPSPSSDISRSHLVVAAQDWKIVVTDLGSTNGTTVLPVGGQPFVLAHGESTEVELGTVLDLGDGVSLRIEPPRG